MHPALKLSLDGFEFRRHSLLRSDPPDGEGSALVALPTVVGKAERGLYADADAAYLYLLNHGYSAQHIVLQGESLGTAVAVDLASRKECAGVVLEAAFTSGRDVANTVLPVIGPLLFRGFDSKSKIANIRAPLLFFHGDRDEIIPLKLGRSLFEAGPEPKYFIEIPGAGHNDMVETAGSSNRERLHEFYGRLQ
jgi:fermentation-respiration switch protein FrsA (DUF1100 family)